MLTQPYGTLRATVRDQDGHITSKSSQDIDSYVIQFLELAAATWGQQSVSGVTDTNGVDQELRAGDAATPVWSFDAGPGTFVYGIQIGTDGTSETVTDNALGTQLTTNISHGDTSVGTGNVSAPSATIDITRTLTNNTGSSVTVNEVGLVGQHEDTSNTSRVFLCLRDTGSPITTIPNGNNATFEYELQITV